MQISRLFFGVSAVSADIGCLFLFHADLLQKSVAKLVTQVRAEVPHHESSAAKTQQYKIFLFHIFRRNKRLHQSKKAQESPGEQPSTFLFWPGHINQSDSSDGKCRQG